MPRPRVPKYKAKATGQDVGPNAHRFKHRVEPSSSAPLGKPPNWMKNELRLDAWETFESELPWLNRSHRALVEIACEIRGRLMSGDEVGVQALGLLRQCLGQMGATPSDSSKIVLPHGDKAEDPSTKYF